MKITLAQLNPKVGDFENNLQKALKTIDEAVKDKPDVIVFPELYLMGYPPQDLLEHQWFIRKQADSLKKLVESSVNYPDTGIIIGSAEPSEREAGRGLYNTAVLINNGEIVFSQAKSLLPTYDVFDEARYFDPAADINVFAFKGERIGLSVCEDAWNDPGLWRNRPIYTCNPIQRLGEQNPTILINISASPFGVGKDAVRYRLLSGHAVKTGVPMVFVNQVGGNDELIFDGRSLCLDAQGRIIAQLPAFEEAVRTIDMNTAAAPRPFAPQDETESVYEALTLGVKDYLGKSGFSKAVVGLSGGIDSAVTCCLAVEALGKDNVAGISMPSMYSSVGSVEDSRKLAENLGVEFHVVPIRDAYDSYIDALSDIFKGRKPNVAEENIQARIRGGILMAYSNKFGHMVLATGNKSELAMGYCTLYGDMCGGLCVLSDVPKTMVYQLAEYINRNGEVLPRETITKPPSAELRPNQKDQDTLPPYDILDQVIQLYVEEGLSIDDIVQKGFEADMVRWVIRTLNLNEYKRKQAAPGLKVTSKAFGVGRRMPLAARHDQ